MTWQPGKSGNPEGRPRSEISAKIRDAALPFVEDAILRLAHEMENGDTSNARIAAAREILDRVAGKPTQVVQTPDQQERVITNEERRLREREIVAKVFGRVFETHPHLIPEPQKLLQKAMIDGTPTQS